MKKIRIVTFEEAAPLAPQIDHWEQVGWRFQGFMRRAEGIWDHIQAVFDMEVGLPA